MGRLLPTILKVGDSCICVRFCTSRIWCAEVSLLHAYQSPGLPVTCISILWSPSCCIWLWLTYDGFLCHFQPVLFVHQGLCAVLDPQLIFVFPCGLVELFNDEYFSGTTVGGISCCCWIVVHVVLSMVVLPAISQSHHSLWIFFKKTFPCG